ncbi:MAG: FixH family protein [Acidobacteria bacterium]|nr:FixH family protein [Acidobacteriota bacterium]
MSNHKRNFAWFAVVVFVALGMLAAGVYIGDSYRGTLKQVFQRTTPAAAAPEHVHETATADTAPASPSEPGVESQPYAPVQISTAQEQLIGVKKGAAEFRNLTTTIRTVGKVDVDETRIAHVHTKVSGWVDQVFVEQTLQHVHQGQPLFSIYSPDLVATQEELLLAFRAQQWLGSSMFPNVSAGANSLLAATRRRLSLWDISPAKIQEIERTGKVQRNIVVPSPVSGHVMERKIYPNTYVTPETDLYMIIDHSRVWMYADIYESEIGLVRVGQHAVATSQSYPEQDFHGRVTFAGPHLEEETRTLKLRMEFSNADLKLMPGMFTSVELQIPLGRRLVVPDSAVVDTGVRQLVFVVKGPGRFDPRDVRLGVRVEGLREIVSGLKAGEEVVTSANFLIDSESQLRAALGGMTMSIGATDIGGQSSAPPSAAQARIEFRTEPTPPRSGKNVVTVTVKDNSGKPVADADVKVVFFMPAMPTMGMAAMRSEATLAATGGGVYGGEITVQSPGTWQVTVTVTKAGTVLGTQQMNINAQ